VVPATPLWWTSDSALRHAKDGMEIEWFRALMK
jgi:hypothetical protein